jgi:hypothetical protein
MKDLSEEEILKLSNPKCRESSILRAQIAGVFTPSKEQVEEILLDRKINLLLMKNDWNGLRELATPEVLASHAFLDLIMKDKV